MSSIRQMSRQPCPACKADTLHAQWKCTACGRMSVPEVAHTPLATIIRREKLLGAATRRHRIRTGTRPRDYKDYAK